MVEVVKDWIDKPTRLRCVILELNLGVPGRSHYTAYVRMPKRTPGYGLDYKALPIDAHGSLTYARSELACLSDGKKGWWIGWDYAHRGDENTSVEEIKTECERVAAQVRQLTWRKITAAKLEYLPDWFKQCVSIRKRC